MNKVAYIVFVICWLFAACQNGQEECEAAVESGKPLSVSFGIGRQQALLALDSLPSTKSAEADGDFQVYFTDLEESPATRTVSQFTNTWLLQFASDGHCVMCRNIGSIAGEGQLTTTLITGENTTLYLLGNGPQTLTQPATLNDFEGNAYFSSKTYQDENTIPYIAKVTGVTLTGAGRLMTTDGNDVVFHMKRIAARLTLTCTTNLPDYRITGIVLYNAPQKMYYGYRPVTAEVKSGPIAAHVVSGDTYTWFIGENLRGTGTSTNQQDRYADKAPVSSTFIRITLQSNISCENTTYDIYPGKDMAGNYDLSRNWDYVYTTTITKTGADVAADKRAQVDGALIDLTAQPSNCYIVEPGKSYKIRIDVKGELDAVVPAGMTISRTNSIASLVVWWQDQPNLVQSLQYVDPQTAIICFRPSVTGNALILGNNSSPLTEWSWHFWVLDNTPAEYVANGVTLMDRNLGATTNDPGSVDFRGLIYEWGRKDPFSGPAKISENVNRQFYQMNGSVRNSERFIGPVGIDVAINHPDWYIYSSAVNGNYSNDWLTPPNADLWGATSRAKTIFDPCPRGWRVPLDHTAWNYVNAGNFVWDATNCCRRMSGGAWFPAAGRYDHENPPIRTESGILQVGHYGYYWVSDLDLGVFKFSDPTDNLIVRFQAAQTFGCSVRPVKVP